MNTNDDQIDWFDLTAYFDGAASRDTRVAVERWIAEHPARQLLVDGYRLAWERRRYPVVPAFDRDAAHAEVLRVIQRNGVTSENDRVSDTQIPISTSSPPIWTPVHKRWAFRASLAMMLCAFGAVIVMQKSQYFPRFQRPSSDQHFTYTTLNGERARITLPDGSSVLLSVASRLVVPADYAAGNRTIRLIGEAVFSVAHRTGTPFTVVAGPSTTRVLGTEFLVRHYERDSLATIAVRRGRVLVEQSVVEAAQSITVGHGVVGPVQSSDLHQLSITNGVLTLPSMTLAEAIPELNRWYNADIQVTDPSIGAHHIEGKFTTGSVGDLAQHLEWGLSLHVVRQGRTIILSLER